MHPPIRLNNLLEVQSKLFIPTITEATRFSNNDRDVPSCIDRIRINLLNCSRSGIINMDFTDDCPTFINLTLRSKVKHNAAIKF